MTLATSGVRRPKRSASMPKMSAPTGRKASVAVVAQSKADFSTRNCAARMSYRKMTTKKSKASRVQPRNPAVTACPVPRGGEGDGTRRFYRCSSFSTGGRPCLHKLKRGRLGFYQFADVGYKIGGGHVVGLLFAARAHVDLRRFHFFVAEHEQERNLL